MSGFKFYNRLRSWANSHQAAGYPLFELQLLVKDIRTKRLDINTGGRDPPGYDNIEDIFIAWSDLKEHPEALLKQTEKYLLDPIFFELLNSVF